ncbi:hypothetical protein HYG86_16610 [Alkalicella caledoniensis]|uniref:Nicotianamine synthase protein n=1 Tax=Alkalicella caledoniensis TaxID=2731377 RepID=A0A7G9WC64_ALKCA|nr:hypothetical protein [Alkalicella caledoniensis]QNO16276.1 hypothetical protein HYG86_16610 [Alkalicella caledoniensis]
MIVKIPALCQLYCGFYKSAVLDEAKLANLDTQDHLLFVGGGAIPYSAIILSKFVKHITVIDRDLCSTKLAKKLITKLGITNITLDHSKAEDLNTSPYTAVFIPLQAEPKTIILKNIKKQSCGHTKIIMRIPKKSFNSVYTSLDELPVKEYTLKNIKQLTFDKVICFDCGKILL